MYTALPRPCLCLVADAAVVAPRRLPSLAAAAVAGGVGMVQLRGKELPGGALLSLAADCKGPSPAAPRCW